ncbi:DUF2637 domain-containing protein [Actinomadura rupiterrae]|uniref:DUF2637 domain-containing protein n=1 Tax=Actinomadura rupiterrae TaxID=559627 RepID=UPI0020A5558B|nr:DUF2637 domain-containing protein [Actinomadura rupiterrae]MCP2336123.1 hypothetical protein [Actinomadura rupiterrae]
MTRPTFLAHRATVVLMAVVVLVATGDGFAQSYAGLYRWAVEHHLAGWKAESFPLLVDLFVAVGELGLFALALEGVRLKGDRLAWADVALPLGIASAGWGVSLVFNVGAVRDAFSDQATAAVPPVASMLGLLVLLRTLHRLVTRSAALEPDTEPVVWADAVPVPEPVQQASALPWWPLPELPAGEQDEDEDDDVPVPDSPVPGVPGDVVERALELFREDLDAGRVPTYRAVKDGLNIGQDRARRVREYMRVLAYSPR